MYIPMTKYGNDRNFLHVLSNTRTPVLAREIVLKENTAVPTYNELLVHYGVDSSTMRETFDDKCLRQFSLALDMWETLAKFLEMPNSDIVNIKSQGDVVVQTLKMFECWKQRRGSMATYEAMVKALLQIGRTDLAEKVITLRQSSRPPKNTQTLSCFQESILTAPTSPASSSSSGIEDAASSAMSPLSLSATTREHTAQEVIQTLSELEDEFYELVTFVETALKRSNVQIDTLTRRFSMLPQSIRRRHQTDENYKAIRQRVLNSESVKKLFDNLTELKHWSYMMPDTLAHILRGVKIEEVHKRISEYKEKLLAFKANTKLKELIGISFPVPDYCMELTMEVERWEDKTIQEVEDRAVNIMRRSDHSGQNTPLGWKAVNVGSVKITFILKKVVKVNKENILDACRDSGIKHVQIDGERLYSETNTEFKMATGKSDMPSKLWYATNTMFYSVRGDRDVLILAPDLSLSHYEAVARRPGQLTEEDRLKLQSQGLPLDCHNELDILNARYELDNECTIVEVKSGKSLSREKAIENIGHLLNTTKNDGVILHYIGAGRRGTGDWCFEDGFITFRDIAQLYLRASHNFKGRVLTIVSDCSYSGCWVRDCMEFLDEQGVQPCGHKAREKGMVIKVFTSCKFNEIPTKYRFSVSGIINYKNTGVVGFWPSKQLLQTQTTDDIDCSELNCISQTINEPCTLQPGYKWVNSSLH